MHKAGQAVLHRKNVMAHKEQSAPFSSANCGTVRYEMKPPPPPLLHQYNAIMGFREIAHAMKQSIFLSLATSQMQSETQWRRLKHKLTTAHSP